MGLSRRSLITGLGKIAVLNGFLSRMETAVAESKEKNRRSEFKNKGRLITVGCATGRSLQSDPSIPLDDISSNITEFDLESGKIRQSRLNMIEAHDILKLPDENFMVISYLGTHCVIVNSKTFKLIKKIKSPDGYDFSGHGAVLDNKAYITMRKLPTRKRDSDHGRLLVLNLSNYEIDEMMDSGSAWPHEVIALPNSKKLAVTHWGGNNFQSEKELDYFDFDLPSTLTLLDVKTKKTEGSFKYTDGKLSHVASSPEGKIIVSIEKRMKMKPGSLLQMQERIKNHTDPVRLSYMEYEQKIYSIPQPVVIADFEKKFRTQTFLDDPLLQRGGFSTIYHHHQKCYVVAYRHSDNLFIIDRDLKKRKFVPSFDFGLCEIQGLCEIPRTPLLAVTGKFRGLAIIDLSDFSVVQRIDAPLFLSSHIKYF